MLWSAKLKKKMQNNYSEWEINWAQRDNFEVSQGIFDDAAGK